MRRWLLAAAADATAEDIDVGGEADSRAHAGAAADAGGAAADLQSDLMVTAQVSVEAWLQAVGRARG
jgi:hypothetical protein